MRITLTAATVGLLVVGGTLAVAAQTPADPAPVSGLVEVAEDAAAWNCYTMGNRDCGTAYTVPGEGFTTGAVLPRANDTGRATVAWSNGPVWADAPKPWRFAAWSECVRDAQGTDESLHACDADWQYPGERFDMRG